MSFTDCAGIFLRRTDKYHLSGREGKFLVFSCLWEVGSSCWKMVRLQLFHDLLGP